MRDRQAYGSKRIEILSLEVVRLSERLRLTTRITLDLRADLGQGRGNSGRSGAIEGRVMHEQS